IFSGRNVSDPTVMALLIFLYISIHTSNVVGIIEVKNIAQNVIQCESALSNNKNDFNSISFIKRCNYTGSFPL
ncbi:28012_t:CDS:1, partial [Racocetra persica]